MEMLTKEQMDANMKLVMDDWDIRTVDDEKFTEAVMIIGAWLHENFMKVGYKRLCRLILSEYKATLPKKKHGRGLKPSVKS